MRPTFVAGVAAVALGLAVTALSAAQPTWRANPPWRSETMVWPAACPAPAIRMVSVIILCLPGGRARAGHHASSGLLRRDYTVACQRRGAGVSFRIFCQQAVAMIDAIRIHAFGGPEVMQWEQVELPPPAAGEITIRQTAIGLNFIDTYHRSGL